MRRDWTSNTESKRGNTKRIQRGEEEKNCFLKFENERDFLHLRPIRSLQNMIVSDKSFC